MRAISAVKKFLRSDDATTAVEYAVMLALILAVIIVGVTSAGGGVGGWWADIRDDLANS